MTFRRSHLINYFKYVIFKFGSLTILLFFYISWYSQFLIQLIKINKIPLIIRVWHTACFAPDEFFSNG
jgi:hypothetical protein